MVISQTSVLRAQTVENGSLKIVDVDSVFEHVHAWLVGLSDDLSAFDSACGPEQAISQRVVIAAGVVAIPRVADFPPSGCARILHPGRTSVLSSKPRCFRSRMSAAVGLSVGSFLVGSRAK